MPKGILSILVLLLCPTLVFAAGVKIDGASVNIRTTPNGRILGSVDDGDVLQIDPSRSNRGNWVPVIFRGQKAYVFRKYTKSTKEEYTDEDMREEKPTRAEDPPPEKKSWFSGLSGSSGCGTITADCSTHRIRFSGMEISSANQVIDCGKGSTTHNGSGTVGGLFHGRIVKDGVDINSPRMGDDNGGKVFHCPWWKPGQMPTGDNRSRGCIHVSPTVLKALKKCKGSRVVIEGATGEGRRERRNENNNSPTTR